MKEGTKVKASKRWTNKSAVGGIEVRFPGQGMETSARKGREDINKWIIGVQRVKAKPRNSFYHCRSTKRGCLREDPDRSRTREL